MTTGKSVLFLVYILCFIILITSCDNDVTGQEPIVTEPDPEPVPEEPSCLESGTHTDINELLTAENVIVELCPGSVFELSDRIVINHPGQQIYTQGRPVDNTRTVLKIVSASLSSAVIMRDFDYAVLSHVIVNGNRPELGYKGGDALIYVGGSSMRTSNSIC